MKRKKWLKLPVLTVSLFFVLVTTLSTQVQERARIEPRIPEIPGYVTIKCDFHMHTVFSDGRVWPTVRVEEAWRYGLDAFSITDHVDYRPYSQDVQAVLGRAYELASPTAEALNLLIIKGAEITKEMPPGHFNFLFVTDIPVLNNDDYKVSIKAALDQGGFVFWNHPPFPQPEGKCVWYPEHEDLYRKGWLHGIEVVNGSDYYPEAHKWCLEKKLTMIASSDIHNPINFEYDLGQGNFRPMTLVLAKAKTLEAIKEALFARRTILYFQNKLIGESKYLKQIFLGALEVKTPKVAVKGKGRVNFQVYNKSDITFELEADRDLQDVSFPKRLSLPANKTVLLTVESKSEKLSGEKVIAIPYKVVNLLIAPDEGLPVELKFKINFVPADRK